MALSRGTDTCLSHALIPGAGFDLARLRGRVLEQCMCPGRFYAARRGSARQGGGRAREGGSQPLAPGSAQEVLGQRELVRRGKFIPDPREVWGPQGLTVTLGQKCPREQWRCSAPPPLRRSRAGSGEGHLVPLDLLQPSPKGCWRDGTLGWWGLGLG